MASIVICSPRPGDGKTTVAAGLLNLLGRRGLGGYRREGGDGADAEFLRSALGLAPTAGASEVVEVDAGAALPGASGPRLVVSPFEGEKTLEATRACADGGPPLGVIVNGVPAAQQRF